MLSNLSLPVERFHEPPKAFGYNPKGVTRLATEDPMVALTRRVRPRAAHPHSAATRITPRGPRTNHPAGAPDASRFTQSTAPSAASRPQCASLSR